ncbi:D-alanyl-D-alanine carboxypeptidase family protein [Bacillus sp. NTK034]|uniref:D-alanyl-D-alanine carboxypeptidase family protein n=1 Tax=Bacillus sp. NTK034 TaxID=2802176 RepID=UPI001A8F388C|nr:D-alanyl-D-alanine carboxypeptidase family protein [Bacillus sp. NTK034]MBN8202779.1 D-alanyl-D-alanine carboxypeptidase [Bacillus sp. NTK034]
MIKQKFICLLSLPFFLLFIWRNELANAKENIQNEINADAWVVMEAETGKVLLDKNMNKQHFPASITKIITAIISIEERVLNEIITVSEHAENTEGSSLALQAGDEISLLDLLYGIMLHSGNDGAVALAEHISTNENDFAQKMTSFAKSIGAKNSHFTNASGLPNDEHYTTAYDMAIITRYAMKNAIFKEMVQHKTYNWNEQLWRDTLMKHEKSEAKEYGIAWEGKPQVINHNRLLGLYKGATGIKNGFTHESRYTLVGSANRNGTELIAVVLRSENADTAYKGII